MVSVLIPIYNNLVVDLVKEIHKQLLNSSVAFEIIGLDDCSSPSYLEKNRYINSLSNTSLLENETNLGRTASRQKLAESATYNWLLFLDSDVMPASEKFITNYLCNLRPEISAVFGGFTYCESRPASQEYTLRYKFGKHREEVMARIRNKTPYKITISANFLIDKQLFLQLNAADQTNCYGLDNLLGANLKQKNIPIKHIDNPVLHLGLDTNTVYLNKIESSLKTLARLSATNSFTSHDNSLINTYNFLRKIHLTGVCAKLTKKLETPIRNQLKSKNPSLFLLDIYKLGYYCRQK